jgi:hypothetical protein
MLDASRTRQPVGLAGPTIGIRPRSCGSWWTCAGGAVQPCWKAGGRPNESESVSEASPILGWFIR